MSADNWATCPQCLAAAHEWQEAVQEAAERGYGTLPLEEFDRLRVEASKEIDPELADLSTFREDYELWVDEGFEFHVTYTGHCSRCHLHHSFKLDERIVRH